jgi:hypothetical protein
VTQIDISARFFSTIIANIQHFPFSLHGIIWS